jgi:hypothetical protein
MATKLKDGVFIGDAEASQDIDFLVSNKIQYVINCAAASVPCSWERLGVRYLTFYWKGSSDCDLSESNVDRMLDFIDTALNSAESVLIHSIDGCSRACAVTAIYFMYKYIWGIDKTMLFIRHQRPDMMPQPAVAKQLDNVNQRLLYKYRSNETLVTRISTISWEPLPLEEQQEGGDDEQLLINTYLNSQSAQEAMMQMAKFQAGMGYNRRQRPSSAGRRNRRRRRKLSWIDEKRGKQKSMMPKSPYSGRVTAERPPGTSYSDIQPGVNWVDTLKPSNAGAQNGTMSRYNNKDGNNGSGISINKNSSIKEQQTSSSLQPGVDNIPLKSILKSSRSDKNKNKRSNDEGQTNSSIMRKRDSNNNTNSSIIYGNNNDSVNIESKYTEEESVNNNSTSSIDDMMVHAQWRNDSSELTMTQSNKATSRSKMNLKVEKNSSRDTMAKRDTSSKPLSRDSQKEKEDLNTMRLNRLLQSGLGATKNNVEIESSVESIKNIDAITHHMRQQQQQLDHAKKKKLQHGAINSNSGGGSISSLSIYTDDDSSEDDSNLLSGLRRIGAQSTSIRSKQRNDQKRIGNSIRSSKQSSSSYGRGVVGINSMRNRSGNANPSSKQRVSTIDRSRQRVRRVGRDHQRMSDDLHMYERRSGTPSRERRSNRNNSNRDVSSSRRYSNNSGGRRRRPPSPGLKRDSKIKSNGGYGYATLSTAQRKPRSRRPGSAPIRKRNSRHRDEYGSSARGGGYGVDYGSVNYSRSALTSLKPKRAGTPNVGKRNQRRQQRVDNMNLSSSLSNLTLSNMAKERQVFNGLSNTSSGTVGAIRALRRRPASAGRAERTDLRMIGNKPIWR